MTTAPVTETFQLGGHRVRVQIRGTGRPLLLLNGAGAPLELWQPLLPRLTGLQTIALDTPGSGGSQTPELPMSVHGHAQLALRLLDTLGYPEVSVLGLSFGGMVAQEAALLLGPRLDRLVLAATSCGWGGVPGSPAALSQLLTPDRYYARLRLDPDAPAGATINPDGHNGQNGHNGHNSHNGRERQDGQSAGRRGSAPGQPVARPPDPRGYLYQFWAAATWSSLPWLHRIGRPTLILTGENDQIVPPVNAKILAALMPDARTHTLPGGGHLCLLERASEVAPLLRRFLD